MESRFSDAKASARESRVVPGCAEALCSWSIPVVMPMVYTICVNSRYDGAIGRPETGKSCGADALLQALICKDVSTSHHPVLTFCYLCLIRFS